jgi:ribosomal 50S subunit-recycling heat shock protein
MQKKTENERKVIIDIWLKKTFLVKTKTFAQVQCCEPYLF